MWTRPSTGSLVVWAVARILIRTNVLDHVETDLVFVEPRYEVLDLSHEWWTLFVTLVTEVSLYSKEAEPQI
jgi:hypothetical protein